MWKWIQECHVQKRRQGEESRIICYNRIMKETVWYYGVCLCFIEVLVKGENIPAMRTFKHTVKLSFDKYSYRVGT